MSQRLNRLRVLSINHPDIGIILDRPERSFFLAQEFRKRGFRVTLYNNVPGSPYHTRIDENLLGMLLYTLNRANHDIYMTSMLFNPALVLYLNKVLKRRPFIFTLNGADWHIFKDLSPSLPLRGLRKNYIYPFLLRSILRAADHIVCNSHYLHRELQDRYPKIRKNSSTIYNGIDFDRFSPLTEKEKRPYTQIIAITTLRFENKSNGAFLLIEAMGKVIAVRKNIRCMIIAKTDERMYHKSVEQYVSDKTWKDHISFVYNHPRVEDLLKTGDIFVFSTPSNSNDSLPRAILEAQAVGLPVVTTATAGCAEIIRDAETGFVVPYDANAMARSVLDLIDNPALRKKFGDRAQLVVREKFTWDQMADHYSKIILKLLNS